MEFRGCPHVDDVCTDVRSTIGQKLGTRNWGYHRRSTKLSYILYTEPPPKKIDEKLVNVEIQVPVSTHDVH